MRILVVDDDPAVRRSLEHALRRDGYDVSSAADGASALAEHGVFRPDAVVLDVLMPEPNGLEVCRALRTGGHDTPILMLTARDLVVDRVAAWAAHRAPRIGFELTCAPTLVHGDPDALERAVANLVDNAVKWSPPDGRIRISVKAGTLEVADTGPGIPDSDLEFVFDRFYRSPAARAHPGSGLGLAIVRQVAEAHGGTAEAVP